MGQRGQPLARDEGKRGIQNFLATGGFQNASDPLHM